MTSMSLSLGGPTSTPSRAPGRVNAIPSAILGMLIFVVTEVMFFCALISSFVVIRSHELGSWQPPGDVRLPVLITALNTIVLLASGGLMISAMRSVGKPEAVARTRSQYLQAIILGTMFVSIQGYEWVKLIGYGVTMTSGIFGATFFLIIGSHGLHALAAVLAMAYHYRRLINGSLTPVGLRAMGIFWLFVVGIWPVLYGLVYFG